MAAAGEDPKGRLFHAASLVLTDIILIAAPLVWRFLDGDGDCPVSPPWLMGAWRSSARWRYGWRSCFCARISPGGRPAKVLV